MIEFKEEPGKSVKEVEQVTIRFAGDSGDGMQLTGSQFTDTTGIVGYDLATLPDYPVEIRAPAGSLGGVSSYQIPLENTFQFIENKFKSRPEIVGANKRVLQAEYNFGNTNRLIPASYVVSKAALPPGGVPVPTLQQVPIPPYAARFKTQNHHTKSEGERPTAVGGNKPQ